ncbi:tRNA methyltransferase 10 homolog A [Trichonephila clavata]|uniref:tRNA (guanine(9)-N(1))-methyltransferase n=1 Tax=Trichonephila clavata TaxID=2740835 RepID=A0A8X6GCY8_TRICU|nr:tRNA methyltransferase 10 homolog A [Trichonephila clavata]
MADDIVSVKENTETDGNPETVFAEPIMSKNQLKRLEKRRRWLEMKPLLKAKRKQKRKLKLQEAKQAGKDLGPSRKLLKSLKMSDSTCKLKICFDLSLAEVMTPAEFSKTFKQLHRCYSINRRASAPLQLHITGYSEATKDLLGNMSGCFNWDVNFNSSTHAEIFSKEKIIYLTSDSPNVIEDLDHDKVYVIGALVDHNRLKNICYEKAIKEGVGHAQLPLDLYFKFKTRKVLTIDQVFSIFLKVTEGKSWIDAIFDTVPKRKGVEIKENFKNSLDNGVQNKMEMDDSTGSNLQDPLVVESSEENGNGDHSN